MILKVFYLFVSLFLMCSFTQPSNINNRTSSSGNYSNVIDDLSKSNSFNIDNYKYKVANENLKNNKNLMCELLTIAEGENGQLYIYTYQPYKQYNNINLEFILNSISFNNEVSNNDSFSNGSFKDYQLTLCNSSNTLYKYVLNDYKVINSVDRYYNILSLFRPQIDGFDTLVSGSTGGKVAVSISKSYRFHKVNDRDVLEEAQLKTVELKPTYIGSISIKNGFTLGSLMTGVSKEMHSHFICFNFGNYIAKYIYDADVKFNTRTVSVVNNSGVIKDPVKGNISSNYVTINDDDKGEHQGSGLFGKSYKWNRISTGSDFIKNAEKQDVNFNTEVKDKINNSQWVFSYYETKDEWTNYPWSQGYKHDYTEVTDVSIFRIHFIDINNAEYNLGVVMDKVTPDWNPDGVLNPEINFGDSPLAKFLEMLVKWIIAHPFEAFMIALSLVVLMPVITSLLPLVIHSIVAVVGVIFKSLLLIIKLPFKLLIAFLKPPKNKDKR